MIETIILSSIGFIFGWIAGKANYKAKLLSFIKNINHTCNSPEEQFTQGMIRGVQSMKMYLIEVVSKNKIGKNYRAEYVSKKNIK